MALDAGYDGKALRAVAHRRVAADIEKMRSVQKLFSFAPRERGAPASPEYEERRRRIIEDADEDLRRAKEVELGRQGE